MKDPSKYNEYLIDFQEDIKRIIGKFRRPNHLLTFDELVSEVNLSLVKSKDSILEKFEGDFDQTAFKKLAYAYTRNLISWSHSRQTQSKYINRREDTVYETEDGPRTSFDYYIDTEGYEEEYYEKFDGNKKCEFLLKMIKEYSGILTDKEIKVLSFLEKGLSQYEIADNLGVTHQAVSSLSLKVYDKIRAYFGSTDGTFLNSSPTDSHMDDSHESVSRGNKAIRDFFSPDKGYSPIRKEHKPKLKAFLLENAKMYNSQEVAKKFGNGRYSKHQILAFAVKNKISFCLVRNYVSYKFSKNQIKEMITLFNEGKSTYEVSESLNIPINYIRGRRSSLTRAGKIPPSGNLRFSENREEEILTLFKEGKTTDEIANTLDLPRLSVAGKKGYFVRVGLLPNLKYKYQPKFSESQAEDMLKLFKEGKSSKEVSKILNLPIRGIGGKRGHFSRCGMIDTLPIRKFSESQNNKIIKLFKDGKSTKEVAEIFDCPLYSMATKRSNLVSSGSIPRIS